MANKLIQTAKSFLVRASDTTLSLNERKAAGDLSARFFGVAKDVVLAFGEIGGSATNYGGTEVAVQIISQGLGGAPIQSIAEAEAIIAEAERAQATEARQSLPCDNWSPDSPDASPVLPYTPPQAKPMDGKQDLSAPSRVDKVPTSDGVGPRGEPAPKTCMVPVFGL